MAARGPRGDITRAGILRAADGLVAARGRVENISLRAVAAEVGVAVNALYTYFPSLDAIWHDLADERLGRLEPAGLLENACPHCALLELAERATTVLGTPGTVSLLRRGAVLGPHSFTLSETILALTEHGELDPRDAHDLIVGWFYGSAVLEGEGWTAGTDAIRDAEPLKDLPRIAGRRQPDRRQQAEALLRGIGLSCSAAQRTMTPGEASGKHPRRYGRTTLGGLLQHPEAFAWSDALYAPPGAVLSPTLPVLVWDVDDVDEDTDLPAEAVGFGYDYVLSIQDVQGVVANARDQRPGATVDDLIIALKHYLGTDAFVQWDSTT